MKTTAQRLNEALDVPACTVVMTGTQAITTSVDTDVSWSGVDGINWTDANGNPMWSAANPTRITIRKDGIYRIGFELHYAVTDVDGKRVASLTRNNTGVPTNTATKAFDSSRFNTLNDPSPLGSHRETPLNVGDILRLSTWQNSGSTQNVIGNTIEGMSFMYAVWDRPLIS
ncbi:hypothetical protein [Amycolatopsis thermoflava]|uniref:hypothetical protein n=1 Tax=Amycolatopsis thermoflava TaxID=84480 RepID=UPI00047F62FB|nr:hypothetical protein [Amycolatopsis thermoflava]